MTKGLIKYTLAALIIGAAWLIFHTDTFDSSIFNFGGPDDEKYLSVPAIREYESFLDKAEVMSFPDSVEKFVTPEFMTVLDSNFRKSARFVRHFYTLTDMEYLDVSKINDTHVSFSFIASSKIFMRSGYQKYGESTEGLLDCYIMMHYTRGKSAEVRWRIADEKCNAIPEAASLDDDAKRLRRKSIAQYYFLRAQREKYQN